MHWLPSRGVQRHAGGEPGPKLERVLDGSTHAALVLEGDECVGWCQFGAPEELPRIKNRVAYEKDLPDLPDWRIACCYVGKGHRRQGAAAAGLSGALTLIAGLGGGRVEGYPEDASVVSAGFLFHGALSTYEQLGFTRDRKIGKHRWVVSKRVDPSVARRTLAVPGPTLGSTADAMPSQGWSTVSASS